MTETQMVYTVELFRTDRREPIKLLQTFDKQEALDTLKEADLEWTNSTHEKRPFRLNEPFVASFLPSLIYEVSLTELSKEEYEQREFVSKIAEGRPFGDTINTRFGR